MIKSRQTSVVILITLAELAWLAAFGLLFAYRGKVVENAKILGKLIVATNEVAILRTSAPDTAKLLDDLKAAEQESKKRANELAERSKILEEMQTQLNATNKLLAEFGRKWDALPPNAAELAKELREATKKLVSTGTLLVAAETKITGLSNRIGQLESGEVAIRRELIGLPTNELRRVVFIVDTSSSMRNSPAWNEARNLMRTWVEYLSVEECVLVNFNDRAICYPANGYLTLRGPGRTNLVTANMDALLTRFDNVPGGTYSDFMAGLVEAYKRQPTPDLIVVFTDGHPHVATKMDSAYGNTILAKVNPRLPILTVAVGSYEVENPGWPNERRNAAVTFLKQVAAKSGGNFIGR